MYNAWERFKDLLKKCPHHEIPIWLQVQTFYNGLTNANRAMIDVAAIGTLMRKTSKEAYELLEEMALNVYQWQSKRSTTRRISRVHSIDTISTLSTQIETLSRKTDTMNASIMHVHNITCDLCR